MMEITKDHVKLLSDIDLRELIAHLCEAEMESKGISTACVSWGGAQTATDGGSDVRVESNSALLNFGYIPKPNTVLQVKKPDMSPFEVEKEMRPKGTLRPIIVDLNAKSGAYIIVSSGTDASDSMLRNRKDKMSTVIQEEGLNNIIVDYYDSQRIASWVRSHPSIVVWVRQKIGQPLAGWRPFENWSNPKDSTDTTFLMDENTRLRYNSKIQSVQEGIELLREQLHKPKSSIRLVGLSGVGKTRLLQALFDERIPSYPLNKSQVIYTDMGYEPTPTPQALAEHLIALNKKIILAVDNCPPELHRVLTKICIQTNSQISLITIEYDIKEDQPDETDVFQLEPSSDELIKSLLKQRFDYLDYYARERITEFSGGNARIAVALASSVEQGQDIIKLSDKELFERLFWQRGIRDDNLLKVAEICSLVYSFSVELTETSENELEVLAQLAEMTSNTFFRHVQELQRRNLIKRLV